jgi:hypothetical protein
MIACTYESDTAGGCRRSRKGWSARFAMTAKALGHEPPKFCETGLRHVCEKPAEHSQEHICILRNDSAATD